VEVRLPRGPIESEERSGLSGDVPAGEVRPLIVTYGSVAQAHGGMQTRVRVTAEIFTTLGARPSIVTTTEPVDPGPVSAWAVSLEAPEAGARTVLSPRLVRLIREAAQGANVVVCTNAVFLPAIVAAGVRLPLIWDTNECQSLHHRRLAPTLGNRAKVLVWLALERWASRKCWRAVAIGSTEAETWRATHPGLDPKLVVVDHSMVFEKRDPVVAREELRRRLAPRPDGPILLFLGTMRAKQNISAARWIVNHLAGALPPHVTILLCGPGSDTVPGLADTTAPGATVVGLGAVDDVDSVVAGSDLCLAPLAAGAGVKTKVLHYLAHGKPVAGTPIAYEGIGDAPGLHTAELDRLPELIRELIAAVESPDAQQRRAEDQRSWFESKHGRGHITEQWKKVLECLPRS
jgi:glycosyltransferase involved in cell wall biosynthesis